MSRYKSKNNNEAIFSIGSLTADFTKDETGLHKRALIAYEGEHTDATGRPHTFTAQRLTTIVANSNKFYNSGADIPVLVNHDRKDPLKIIGSVESPFEARTITEEDLPNPRAKELIGKVGIFCNDLVVKAQDYITNVEQKLVKSVSMGLDLLSETIKEVSMVTLPAMKHAVVFRKANKKANFSTSWEEYENSGVDEEAVKEKFETFTEGLWDILKAIFEADDADLSGKDPSQLTDAAFEGFKQRVVNLLGLNEQYSETQDLNPYGSLPGGSYDTGEMAGQRLFNEGKPSTYSVNSSELANFETMISSLLPKKSKKKKKSKYTV